MTIEFYLCYPLCNAYELLAVVLLKMRRKGGDCEILNEITKENDNRSHNME